MNKNPWIVSVLISVVLLIVLGVGVLVGRYTVIKGFKNIIDGYQKSETLGNFVTDQQKSGISTAYGDVDNALQQMDNISFDVPKAFTPFVGSAPLPGTHNNATINSMQFRSDSELQKPKPSDVVRIFLTGASTAYGSGAPDQQKTIGTYLSNLLNSQLSPMTNHRYEVLTFATPAWASTQERIAIENRLSELEPDLVISLSGNNDVHWGSMGKDVLWFRTYSDNLFFALINNAYQVAGYPRLPDVTETQTAPVPASLVGSRLIKNVMLSAYALDLKKIPYFYFLQPTIATVNKNLTARESQILTDQTQKDYYRECFKLFDEELSILNIENFHYFNLSSVFENLDQSQEIFIDRSHFGDKGYELIANAIFSKIRDDLAP